MTGLPDVLLENRTWCEEGFVDVSNLLAQPTGEDFCTLSATWFDVDRDGWVDLFAWDPNRDGGDSYSRLLMNHGSSGFGIACLFPTSQNDYKRVVRRC
ncbi:MAG TPA: hypothetical protein P5571_12385 [Candidatus Krumholzibacteria bacterium]|nr:hypothetical protein [Candidatus Krumholzibacteria bacterium]HRX52158.1 hypothetical protein [Candidatus Krumholzibacteria bacterium]